jgi:hypothetical protein
VRGGVEVIDDMTPEQQKQFDREWLEERAAIIEYCGNFSRPEAERLAREQYAKMQVGSEVPCEPNCDAKAEAGKTDVCLVQDKADGCKLLKTEREDTQGTQDTCHEGVTCIDPRSGDDFDGEQRVYVHIPWYVAIQQDLRSNLESWVELAGRYFDVAPEYCDLGALYAAVTHSFPYCVRLGGKNRSDDAKIDLWPKIPYLAINAPTEGAGKSNLAKLMSFTCMNAINGSASTNATIVRDCANRWPLTMITDDVDSQNESDPVRWAAICSLANLGFEYATRGVQEQVAVGGGKDKRTEMVTKHFTLFYPKVFAGIKLKGHLPRPTWSRCLPINMQVSSMASNFEQDEPRIKIKAHKLRDQMADVARRMGPIPGAFRADGVPELANNPRMSRQLAPPLLDVAAHAGDEWQARAARALIYVDANMPKKIDTNRLLICDLWEQCFTKFPERLHPKFVLTTGGAIDRLQEMKGRPWATWHKGRPISPQSLADHLAEWQCAPSRHYDLSGKQKRGLLSSAVKAAYERARVGMDLDDGDIEQRD